MCKHIDHLITNELKERFENHWVPEPNSGCWLWTSATSHGYGVFQIRGETYRAHRVSYELYRGRIPEDLHIDHLCRNRCCINPNHLEPVTNAENTRRGVAAEVSKARYAAQTHCKNGHLLSGNNLTIAKGNGQRVCRTCRIARKRAWRAKHFPPVGLNLEGLKLGGLANGARQRAKTHCPHGHEYSPDNICASKDGFRRCKTCHREQAQIRNARKREVKQFQEQQNY